MCCGTVTAPQCVVLQSILDEASDVSTLAERLGTTLSATTRLVDGLERRAWVQRTRDPEDRRRVVVALTKQGRKEAARLRELTHHWADRILDAIPQDKHEQVLDSLRLVREALVEARAEACCE